MHIEIKIEKIRYDLLLVTGEVYFISEINFT